MDYKTYDNRLITLPPPITILLKINIGFIHSTLFYNTAGTASSLNLAFFWDLKTLLTTTCCYQPEEGKY